MSLWLDGVLRSASTGLAINSQASAIATLGTAAVAGTSLLGAAADHTHPGLNATDSVIAGLGVSGSAGTSAHAAAADHTHPGITVQNVLSYGADATGVKDSTTAFQDAINAANNPAAGGSSVVFVPSGTYLITAGLTIPSGVTLRGASGYRSIAGAFNSTINYDPSASGTTCLSLTRAFSSGIENLVISGAAGLPASTTGIDLVGSSSIVLDQVVVKGPFATALHITGNSSGASSDILCHACEFDVSSTNQALVLTNFSGTATQFVSFRECTFSTTGTAATVSILGVGGVGAIQDVTFTGGNIEGPNNSTAAIEITNAQRVYFQGTLISQSATANAVTLTTSTGVVLQAGFSGGSGLPVSADSTSQFYVVNTAAGHLQYGGPAPAVASGANIGTNPTAPVLATADDTAGACSWTTGTGPAAGAQAVVTFGTAYATTPRVQVAAANGATAAAQPFVSGVSTTGFTINLQSPAASTAYEVVYQVIG